MAEIVAARPIAVHVGPAIIHGLGHVADDLLPGFGLEAAIEIEETDQAAHDVSAS
jgi:hypothetical protein